MRKAFIFASAMLLAVASTGCNDDGNNSQCTASESYVEGACCTDTNNNNVCDADETESDCKDEEAFIDGICCVDADADGVCDADGEDHGCEDDESYINEECCVDSNDNGVCDDGEIARDCTEDESYVDGLCCPDANDNGACDDNETEQDCTDDQSFVGGICCKDLDHDGVCDDGGSDDHGCAANESYVDDACCVDENGNDVCDTDETQTITGTVFNLGSPQTDVTVYLDDDLANGVVTGSDGTFTFEDAPITYTLTLQNTRPGNTGPKSNITVYEGLTDPQPKLPLTATAPTQNANVGGNVDISAITVSSGDLLKVATSQRGASFFVTSGGTIDSSVLWYGRSHTFETPLTPLHFSRDAGPNDHPEFYNTGAPQTYTLQSLNLLGNIQLTLDTPVSTKDVSIDVDPGAYDGTTRLQLLSVLVNDAHFLVGTFYAGGETLPLTQEIPETGALFEYEAQNADDTAFCKIYGAGSSDRDLKCPDQIAMSIASPMDGATDIGASPLVEWAPVDGAKFYLVKVSPASFGSSETKWTFVVPASTTQIDLSDYASLDTLPPSTGYRAVVQTSTESTLDLHTLLTEPLGFIALERPQSDADVFKSVSTFTTDTP